VTANGKIYRGNAKSSDLRRCHLDHPQARPPRSRVTANFSREGGSIPPSWSGSSVRSCPSPATCHPKSLVEMVCMTNLFVGNLASNRTPDELRTLFQTYGSVEGVEIMTDPQTRYSRRRDGSSARRRLGMAGRNRGLSNSWSWTLYCRRTNYGRSGRRRGQRSGWRSDIPGGCVRRVFSPNYNCTQS
jgi:RNA recognition motif. (a.k.a. RRM, RBD, or RNP domain)